MRNRLQKLASKEQYEAIKSLWVSNALYWGKQENNKPPNDAWKQNMMPFNRYVIFNSFDFEACLMAVLKHAEGPS